MEMRSHKMKIKVIIFSLLIIFLLTMTFGCVSDTEQDSVEVANEPNETELAPTQTPIPITTSTATSTPIVIEIYDDEEFSIWLNDSIGPIKNYTIAINRQGNWGKTLKEKAGDELIELEKFKLSPKFQEIAEKYEYALETYQQVGYYAESGTTRTEGVSDMSKALSCLSYGDFQFEMMEALLQSDTELRSEPDEFNIKIAGHVFLPPIDLKIPMGKIVRWRNLENNKNPRYLISEDGLWEEPIQINYNKYHEFIFNETGTFHFSLKYNEIASRQKITII